MSFAGTDAPQTDSCHAVHTLSAIQMRGFCIVALIWKTCVLAAAVSQTKVCFMQVLKLESVWERLLHSNLSNNSKHTTMCLLWAREWELRLREEKIKGLWFLLRVHSWNEHHRYTGCERLLPRNLQRLDSIMRSYQIRSE